MKSEQGKGNIKILRNIFWISLIIAISLRFWLAANHFAHYDDLWGMYRAISIKGMDADEFIEKVPAFSQEAVRILTKINIADWLLRHIASVKEATYMTTLAPLHYVISLVPTGIASNYKETLLAGRITSVLEYLIFILLAIKLSGILENERRRIYQFYIALTLFGGLPLFYSAQGHNYMGGVAATVIYIIILNRYSGSKINEAAIRAGTYCLLILMSYTFIIYLPAYIACEIIIGKDGIFSDNKREAYEGAIWKKKTSSKTKEILTKVVIIAAPIILSILLKDFYMMQAKEGSLGIGWNSGINNEYIVNYQDAGKFLEYFWSATKTTIASLFLPSLENRFLNQIVGGTTIVLIILGTYDHIIWYGKSGKKLIDTFAIMSILTTVGLYLTGKIAISPTRHSLSLILFIALISSRGGLLAYKSITKSGIISDDTKSSYLEKRKQLNLKRAMASALMIITITYYWEAVKFETLKRVDNLDRALLGQIAMYDKIYISGYRNFSLAMAPELGKMEETEIEYLTWVKTKEGKNNRKQKILYFNNDPSINVEYEIQNKIKKAEHALKCEPSKVIKDVISTTTPDLAPEPLTPIGTNTVRAYEVECSYNTAG